jgi:DMSO/TMAO reductase YedYZ molybdopterin-dependent catalytic subunit
MTRKVLDGARVAELPAERPTRFQLVANLRKWTGVPFRSFLERIGGDLTAKYVGFECADGY